MRTVLNAAERLSNMRPKRVSTGYLDELVIINPEKK